MNDKIAGVLVVGDREDVDAPKGRRRGDHVGGRFAWQQYSRRLCGHNEDPRIGPANVYQRCCRHDKKVTEGGAGGRDVTLDDLSGMIKDLDFGRLDRWSIANQDTCSNHANKGEK